MSGGGKTSQASSTASIPPEVMARYNSVNAVAQNVAQNPFQSYSSNPSAFVAPLNATQQAGIQNTNTYAGAAQPYFAAATNTLGQAQANANPYYNTAGQYFGNAAQTGNQYAGASTNALQGAQQAGAGLAGASYNTLQAANAKAAPYLQAATGYGLAGGQRVDPSQLNAPAIQQYMSPFLNNVYGATLAGQAQQNAQQLSGLKGEAIKSGAFGGDRAGIAAGNLAYQQNLANSQINANLLNTGYMNALNTAGQQQALGLGAGQANRAALQQTAGQMLGIGQQQFNEGATTAAQQAALGQQQFGQGAAAAQQFAGLGQQQFGQGQASGAAAQGLGAGLYGMGASTSQQLAALGSGAQTAGLQGAQAQGAAGATAQQTEQAGRTAQYNQFLQEQGYPFQVAQFLANIAMGTGALSGGTTTSTTPRGILAARGGAINDRVERYAGGLVNASMGGHVYPQHAGEHYADGGEAQAPAPVAPSGGGESSFFNTSAGNSAAQSDGFPGFPGGQGFGSAPFQSQQAAFAFPSATSSNSGDGGFPGFPGGLLPSYTSVAPSQEALQKDFTPFDVSSLRAPRNTEMADWQKLIATPPPKPPVDYGAGDGAYRTRSDAGPEGGAPGATSPFGQVGVNTTGSPWGDAKGMVNAISDAISGTSQPSGPMGSGGSYTDGTSSGYDQSRGGRIHKAPGGLALQNFTQATRAGFQDPENNPYGQRDIYGPPRSPKDQSSGPTARVTGGKPVHIYAGNMNTIPAAPTAQASTGVLGGALGNGTLLDQYRNAENAITLASRDLRGTAADGNQKATSGLFGAGGQFGGEIDGRPGFVQRQISALRAADGGLIGRHHYADGGGSDALENNPEYANNRREKDDDADNVVPTKLDIPVVPASKGLMAPSVTASGGGSGGSGIGGELANLGLRAAGTAAFGPVSEFLGSILGRVFADGGGVAPHHYAEGGLAGRRGYEGGGYPGAGVVYPDDLETARALDQKTREITDRPSAYENYPPVLPARNQNFSALQSALRIGTEDSGYKSSQPVATGEYGLARRETRPVRAPEDPVNNRTLGTADVRFGDNTMQQGQRLPLGNFQAQSDYSLARDREPPAANSQVLTDVLGGVKPPEMSRDDVIAAALAKIKNAQLQQSGISNLDDMGAGHFRYDLQPEQPPAVAPAAVAPAAVAPAAVAPQAGANQNAPVAVNVSERPPVVSAPGTSQRPDYDPLRAYRDATASIESGGNYGAKGPVIQKTGDRAFGKYQVMGANIPAWTKEVLGMAFTPEEFLKDADAQDRVFNGIFGKYVEKYGLENAASMWHSGLTLDQARAKGREDPLGTKTVDYVSRFMNHVANNGGDGETGGGQGSSGGLAGSTGPVARARDAAAPVSGGVVPPGVQPLGAGSAGIGPFQQEQGKKLNFGQRNIDLFSALGSGVSAAAGALTPGSALIRFLGGAGEGYVRGQGALQKLAMDEAATQSNAAATAQVPANSAVERFNKLSTIYKDSFVNQDGRLFVRLKDGNLKLLFDWKGASAEPLYGGAEAAQAAEEVRNNIGGTPSSAGEIASPGATAASVAPVPTGPFQAGDNSPAAKFPGFSPEFQQIAADAVAVDRRNGAALDNTARTALGANAERDAERYVASTTFNRTLGSNVINLAKELNNMGEGVLTAPGALQAYIAPFVRNVSDLAKRILNVDISTDEIAAGTAAAKIATALAGTNTAGLDQRSLSALQIFIAANPGPNISKDAAMNMISKMIVEKQRNLDEAKFYQLYKDAVAPYGFPSAGKVQSLYLGSRGTQDDDAAQKAIYQILMAPGMLQNILNGKTPSGNTFTLKDMDAATTARFGVPLSSYFANQ